ncbi:hypothetical protein LQW54_007503 [Pestalotiopsis sp. IQ-011]
MQYATIFIDELLIFRKGTYDRPPLNKMVIYQQESLQDYLEENSKDDKNGASSSMPGGEAAMSMDSMIDNVEAGVVIIYSQHFGKPKSADKYRFSQVLEVIAGLRRHLHSQVDWIEQDSDSMARIVEMSHPEYEDYVKNIFTHPTLQHPWGPHHYSFTDTMINFMVEKYWEKIVTATCEFVVRLRTDRPWALSLVNEDWMQVIQESRQNGRLSSSYVDWVTTGIDTSMLKDARDKYVRRRGTPDQSCDRTDSQEFCPNLMAPRTVSLALAKGHSVTRIKEVSEDDLASFGWYRESLSHPLWRCQPVGVGRDIVKVDVDGKILGLFALKRGGSDWHDWVLVEPTDESPRSPRARPISESEADVLGLRGQKRPKLPRYWLSSWP